MAAVSANFEKSLQYAVDRAGDYFTIGYQEIDFSEKSNGPGVENSLNCRICGVRSFPTEPGLRQHERHCSNNFNGNADANENEAPNLCANIAIINPDGVDLHGNSRHEPGAVVENVQVDAVCGPLSVPNLSQIINAIYEEIVHWRQNLFVIPSGSAGKDFVREMTRLIELWNNDTALKSFSLKALMIIPTLLLQKPSYRSKSKEHAQCLERRLKEWKAGNFDKIMKEIRAIQSKRYHIYLCLLRLWLSPLQN